MLTLLTLICISFSTGLEAKLKVPPCNLHLFQTHMHLCLSDFNSSMETTGYRTDCPWPTVKVPYNKLRECVEHWANTTLCKGVGSTVNDFFLDVHQTYFSLCGQVQDPPLFTLVMLVAPVVITTLSLPLLCLPLTTNKT